MRVRRPLLGALALLLASAGLARADVGDYIGKPIRSIEFVIEGRRSADPTLAGVTETRVGSPLSMAEVRESITHLFSLGRFEDVRVDATLGRDGAVSLSYRLSPFHPVHTVAIVTPSRSPGVDRGALRQAIVDRYGESPAVARAPAMEDLIRDMLRQRGYLHPTLSSRLDHEQAGGRVRLIFALQPGPRTRIGSVDIVGAPPMPRKEVRDRFGVAPEIPYQSDVLDARISRYVEAQRRRGYYEAKVVPSVRLSDDDRVADVTLTVSLGPHGRVVFNGDSLPSDVRAQLVPVEREGSVDEDLLEDSSRRIEEYLKGQGYRDAAAPHTRVESDGELLISFDVKKGPHYRIETIATSGNDSIPSAALQALLRVREGQPLSDARLEADAATIEGTYQRTGFASARVQTAVEMRTAAGGQIPVLVRIDIREGPRTIVSSVRVVGNEAVSAPALVGTLGLQPGRPFSAIQMALDRDAIQLAYADLGYQRATVEAKPGLSRDGTSAEIAYVVNEGPRLFVDHLLIVGNARTNTSTIERELLIKAGDPLSLSAVNDSQRRLASLGLFRRTRIVELSHGDETTRDLLVTVEEAPATTIGYGGGFEVWDQTIQQAGTGVASQQIEFAPRASFEIGRRNLFGKNRSVNLFTSLSLRPDSEGNHFGFAEYRLLGTFREPRLFDTAADAFVTGTLEQQIRSSFKFARRRGTVEAVRRLTPKVSVSGSYQLESTRVFDEVATDSDQHLIDRLFPQVLLSSFSLSSIRDTRDDQVDPSRGEYLSASGQIAGRAIGSAVGLVKGFMTGQIFRTIPSPVRHVVFAGSARLGLAAGFPRTVVGPDGGQQDVRDLPASERFFAGGDTTNRGFALDTLGAPATIDSNGFPLGGNALVILNAELRIPVHGALGAVGFLDTGNVFARATDINLGELRSAAGFGVRYRSPVGPIRVDLGFKLRRQNIVPGRPEGLTALQISLGQAF